MPTIQLTSQPVITAGKLKEMIANFHDDCEVNIAIDVYGHFEGQWLRQQLPATAIERCDQGTGKPIVFLISATRL